MTTRSVTIYMTTTEVGIRGQSSCSANDWAARNIVAISGDESTVQVMDGDETCSLTIYNLATQGASASFGDEDPVSIADRQSITRTLTDEIVLNLYKTAGEKTPYRTLSLTKVSPKF